MVKKLFVQSGSYALMCGVACGALFLALPDAAQAGFSFVPAAEEEPIKNPIEKESKVLSVAEEVIVEDSQNMQNPIPPADIAEEVLPPLSDKSLSIMEDAPETVQPVFEPEERPIPAIEMAESMEDLPILKEDKKAGIGPVIDGFGSDIPLVVALRQIIPSEYSFIFGDKLDLGMRVDWQGGQSWDVVLQDLAKAYGFNVDISRRIVKIGLQKEKPAPVIAIAEPLQVVPEPVISKPSPEETPLLTRSQTQPQPLSLPDMEDLTKKEPEPAKEYKVPVKEQSGSLFTKKQILVERPDGAVRAIESEPKAVSEYEIQDMPESEIEWKTQDSDVVPEDAVEEKPVAPTSIPVEELNQPVNLINTQENTGAAENILSIELDEPPSDEIVFKEPNVVSVEQDTTAASEEIVVQDVVMAPVVTETVVSDELDVSVIKPAEAFFIEDEVAVWEAEQGSTLRSVLQKWANAEGISMVWSSEYDYPIHTEMQIVGTFEEAVRSALDGFERASPRPMGRLHTNKPTGAPVLVIESERLTN